MVAKENKKAAKARNRRGQAGGLKIWDPIGFGKGKKKKKKGKGKGGGKGGLGTRTNGLNVCPEESPYIKGSGAPGPRKKCTGWKKKEKKNGAGCSALEK